MKFVYVGEAPNGSIQQYGYTFTPGQMVEVDDPAVAAKLARNHFFKQARRVVAAAEPAEPEQEAPKPKGRPKKVKPEDNGDGGGAG
jgi:hypothetical protein